MRLANHHLLTVMQGLDELCDAFSVFFQHARQGPQLSKLQDSSAMLGDGDGSHMLATIAAKVVEL